MHGQDGASGANQATPKKLAGETEAEFIRCKMVSRSEARRWIGLLQAAEVTRCGMQHEQIQMKRESGLPVADGMGGFRRRGFCERGHRSKQLECAHSTARGALRDAIHALARSSSGGDAPAETHQALMAEFQAVELGICLLDGEKSDAEKSKAELLERADGADPAGTARALEAVEAQIAALIAEYDGYCQRIDRLRFRVIGLLDQHAAGTQAERWHD